ncbi:nucleotide-diphospho-sugar transferase [Tribonema minus]|uniref:Nucleotide-diphospho-sugar transferase n=1 Tax=Tribonema minus TaxID=303371 RepID=A0A835ZHD0_9STRA|nr:nucleotide-diphospho-sugar transferase [Tribonema minus]
MKLRIQSWKHLVDSAESVEEGLRLIAHENVSDETVLPEPPTDVEMMSYIDTRRTFIIGFGMFSCLPLIIRLWLFTLVEPFFVPMALLVSSYLLVSYFAVAVWGRDMRYEDHELVLTMQKDYKPTVDIFLPNAGEPIEVLNNTFRYIAGLDWEREKLNVYVLDDGPRPHSVKSLANQYGFNYIRRPNPGHMKKAGNLRYAFTQTHGDIIIIFDADFTPRHDFLLHTVPYFNQYPKAAIVQTPQYFTVKPEQTWVERGAGSTQQLFYRLVQQNRQRFDATICVGSAAAYRRVALEPLGGTANIGFSKDVHTSFFLSDSGWVVRYLPLPMAKGTCPDRKKAFFTQNYRWATGSLMLTTSSGFWRSNLTLQQKVCYASGGAYYISTALSLFANAVPSIVLVLTRPHLVIWYNTLFAVPSLLFPFIAMRMWSTQHYGLESIRIRWLQYSAHLMALYDQIFGEHMVWVPTGAVGNSKNRRYNTAMAMLLHVTVAQMVMLYAGCAWRLAQGYMWYNFLPSLLMETINVLICFQVLYK